MIDTIAEPPKTKLMLYDVSEELCSPADMAAYLDAWLIEAPDDAEGLAHALGDIARAIGMTQLAQKVGISREQFFEAVNGNSPDPNEIIKVARALESKLQQDAA